MISSSAEIEQVSPNMIYWILAIIIAVAAVYFILGIQVEASSAADFAADPTQFTFVCPLGAYH